MIAAIILAAGQSARMGQPKMLLPWGKTTVIEHVVVTFRNAGVEEILVITGGGREEVEEAISNQPVRTAYNAEYARGEMLSSLQHGLAALPQEVEAALIGLGDQPQVKEGTVRLIRQAYEEDESRLVIPSFQMKRGHPWLVARPLWDEILAMKPPQSPRDFLNKHASEIHYVEVETASILTDLDTPEDYRKFRP
jgi:molybdenum cofactor cytidylyltransferase